MKATTKKDHSKNFYEESLIPRHKWTNEVCEGRKTNKFYKIHIFA